ncbi:hypothetical protein DAPPUDRAFT_248838 [Daphnia pulex]|uniref:Uncharacterized protein n=1 Tax=Daphnia pulex TaxID=6669 RepID=E9GVB4_DAPPU|nr:hypothetical protein DAPPUDRAFT_248838 [Daphnia pulex]|eukprot:EFX76634.1 hypothetical protein DAPPUDRAFT_248838 [Daphnia pulex]
MAYLINFWLAPFFRESKKSCKNDKETQINGQIDLAVHYYIKNEDNKEVVTQYFNSAFPPKASASDLLSKFKESLSGLPV